jgi:purine-binding chemotaxis protein CheW
MVVFQLATEEYCLDVRYVKSIERLLPITRVPGVPTFVKGVINLRGVVTPVIDLKLRLDLPESPFTDHSRMIMVAHDDVEVGLIVDAANDVIDIEEDGIEPPPEVVGTSSRDYIQGVSQIGQRLLTILNLEKVLDREALHSSRVVGIEQ